MENVYFESPLRENANLKLFSSAYRYVHVLLMINEVITPDSKHMTNADAYLQYRELLSDLAASEFLILGGLYKPARMMLRSSIENLLRVVALEQGFIASGAKFTYELITLVQASKFGRPPSPTSSDLGRIIELYGKLCAYTHASSLDFLALRIPLISISAFDQKEYNLLVSNLQDIARRYCRVLSALYWKNIDTAPHRQKDFILDALPKKLKRHYSS